MASSDFLLHSIQVKALVNRVKRKIKEEEEQEEINISILETENRGTREFSSRQYH